MDALELPPEVAAARERLQQLREHLAAAMPEVSAAVTADSLCAALRLHLPNGSWLIAYVDSRVPQGLYELVRFIGDNSPEKYSFESSSALGAACTPTLSSQAVVEQLRLYAAIPAAAVTEDAR